MAPLIAQTAAQKPAATAAPAGGAEAVDGGWPRGFTTGGGAQLVLYQPQISAWDNQKHMTAYSAVSYTKKGETKPQLGTVKFEADTSVSAEDRLVSLTKIQIAESNFGGAGKDDVQDIVKTIDSTIPDDGKIIALDRVLANIDKSAIIPKNVEGIKADPPVIFFSKTPAVLVNVDGQPIWSTIEGNDLKFAVNTNWDLFQHEPTKTLYLLVGESFLKASDLGGPWTYAGDLPDSFKKLPADDNWKDVKDALPGKKLSPEKTPKVFTSTAPAELILLTGEPKYVPVTGASPLQWVSNTESDIFRMGPTGPVYYLVAGRWFSSADFNGPWIFATPNMPEQFKKIPLEHDRSRVLASVPGTEQAAEAVLLSQIPQTATVQKSLQAPEVKYNGDPKFEPVEKTTVSRAVNTDKDIIKVGDLYYMCFQGVWFMSRTPTGPWQVTGEVPKQIYEIPVSSPSYNVTYVTVEENNNDAVVFATAMAFTGLMVAWGCAVWGTGYYYPPYYYPGVRPIYYPYYPTYGYAAAYNPWTGTYARGAVAYGPYGGAGVAARYNPSTGVYSRSAAAWGPYGSARAGTAYNSRTGTYARGAEVNTPYGSRGAAQAYNPRTGTGAQTRQGSNVYGNWGSTQVQRGDNWASTSHVTNNRTGTTTRTGQTSGGGQTVTRNGQNGSSFATKTGGGDMYAGHDGNVYKKTDSGWQQYTKDGGWNNVQQPTQAQRDQAKSNVQNRAGNAGNAGTAATTRSTTTPRVDSSTMGQLSRDSSARSTGTARTGTYEGVRSSGMGGSSYRPPARGGGGRIRR